MYFEKRLGLRANSIDESWSIACLHLAVHVLLALFPVLFGSLFHVHHFESLRVHRGEEMRLPRVALRALRGPRLLCSVHATSSTFIIVIGLILFLVLALIALVPLDRLGTSAFHPRPGRILPPLALDLVPLIIHRLFLLAIIVMILGDHTRQPLAIFGVSPAHQVLILRQFSQDAQSVMIRHRLLPVLKARELCRRASRPALGLRLHIY